jgi:tetratricopeptide (TPR) repeat protein
MKFTAVALATLLLFCAVAPGGASGGSTQPSIANAKPVQPQPPDEEVEPKDEQRTGDWLDEWSARVPKVLLALGGLAVAVFVIVGFCLLVYAAAIRLVRPSLVIKPFVDTGVEAKVGSVVAALVEEQLVDLARKGQQSGDAYQLDLVVANVELLARDEHLATAVSGLADVSQLKVVVAVLSLVDRVFGRRSLVAEGELMPDGQKGSGLVLALYRHNELRARDAHWSPPPQQRHLLPHRKPTNDSPDPEPYYRLAPPAASWVQFEAARSLSSHVALMTDHAESFRLLATGLAQHRAEKIQAAASAYARALSVDPGNVAALVNLAMLLARYERNYRAALMLLRHAEVILKRRHEETE